MIKGIIFDLDGTLLYTLDDLTDALNLALEEYGFRQLSVQEVKANIGNGVSRLVKDSLPDDVDEETFKKALERNKENYNRLYLNKTKPYQGISETLQTIQNKGIKIALNTNKAQLLSENLMKNIFPEINFIKVVGDDFVSPKKPDPSGVYKILETFELNKDEVIYVGDSAQDMLTAYNAGIKSIGCLWGFRDRKTLEENNATYIINKPEEILNYLGD